MKGHIRRRGASWEFIIDVGAAAAQRCESCGKRFWVDRKLKPDCPACGGLSRRARSVAARPYCGDSGQR